MIFIICPSHSYRNLPLVNRLQTEVSLFIWYSLISEGNIRRIVSPDLSGFLGAFLKMKHRAGFWYILHVLAHQLLQIYFYFSFIFTSCQKYTSFLILIALSPYLYLLSGLKLKDKYFPSVPSTKYFQEPLWLHRSSI